MLTYVERNTNFARNLRQRMTEAEQRLWFHLRHDQMGVRGYRQKPLGKYIVDFYLPKAKLVIELDGSQHNDDLKQHDADRLRDAWLHSQGLRVLRFDDRQVLTETEAVLEAIFSAVREATAAKSPPSPPFAKGGEPLACHELHQSSLEEGNPQACTEGFPPLQKGGQGGFSGASNIRSRTK